MAGSGTHGPRPGRRSRIIGGLGLAAITVALVAPGVQGAAASTSAAYRGKATLVLDAQLRELAATVQQQRLALRLIATPVGGGDLGVYANPGDPAPSQVLPAVNELGSPLAVLAVERQADWYRVLLPTRPNASSAWVPVGAVSVTTAPYRVELSLSALDLRVIDNATGAVVVTSPIGIGAPSSPTPTGEFFVRDHFPTPGGDHPYGPFAFGLSGHSDVYMRFGTGDGRIAIHGTNQPASIGAAVSNGCPHVPNDVVLALIPYLPLGTPVTIAA